MCSNYVPVTQSDRLLAYFGVHRDPKSDTTPADAWPAGMGPFIRIAVAGSGNTPVVDDARFGLVPPGRMEMAKGVKKFVIDKKGYHNAKSETVDLLPSFKKSWQEGRRCVIPTEWFYEPLYKEDESTERWRISLPGNTPMGIAGIYRWSTFEDGTDGWSFAMLTVNADQHPVMSRFHAPGKEKRMVVILEPKDYGPWLQCSVEEAKGFCKMYEGPLETVAAPLPPRARKTPADPKPPKVLKPKIVKPPKPTPPTTGDLF